MVKIQTAIYSTYLIKREYHLIMLFVLLCWKRRYALCNASETNSNNILPASISYPYCQSKFVHYYAKLSKHIEARCWSAVIIYGDRINKINHGSMLYLRSN